jgi:hypothetical protein
MDFLNVIGWIGSGCFAICAVPQAYTAVRQGHSNGISWLFLALWLTGEVLTIAYVLPKWDFPLLVNYFGNLACLLVILHYKIKPRG